jgi:glycosyltransferase involved in cell wall biosynthesis
VIHKENQGLGGARNSGIDAATGEYICFFDSDDYIREDTVETVLKAIQAEHADYATFGHACVNSEGNVFSEFIPDASVKTFRGSAVWEQFLPGLVSPDYLQKRPRQFYMSAWDGMYSMAVIRSSGWRFVSERELVAEDVYSLLALFEHISTVTIVPEALYFYRVNDQSLSRSYLPNRYRKVKHFYTEAMDLCRRIGYNEDVLHRVSKPYLAFTLSAMKQESRAELPFRQKMANLKEIIKDDVLQAVLQQNKSDKVSWTRWAIFACMRKKWYVMTYLLLRSKS